MGEQCVSVEERDVRGETKWKRGGKRAIRYVIPKGERKCMCSREGICTANTTGRL